MTSFATAQCVNLTMWTCVDHVTMCVIMWLYVWIMWPNIWITWPCMMTSSCSIARYKYSIYFLANWSSEPQASTPPSTPNVHSDSEREVQLMGDMNQLTVAVQGLTTMEETAEQPSYWLILTEERCTMYTRWREVRLLCSLLSITPLPLSQTHWHHLRAIGIILEPQASS